MFGTPCFSDIYLANMFFFVHLRCAGVYCKEKRVIFSMMMEQLVAADTLRLTRMEDALRNAENNVGQKSKLSQRTILRLKYFIPSYKQYLGMYSDAVINLDCREDNYQFFKGNLTVALTQYIERLTQLFVSGSLPESCKCHYRFFESTFDLRLKTDEDLLGIGRELLEGENQRMMLGGVAVVEPRIAIVKIKYDQFAEAQKMLVFSRQNLKRTATKFAEFRTESEELLTAITNENEFSIVACSTC